MGKKKLILGLCHCQLGIALFPKMGIPSRPRINGTVGTKCKKKPLINIQESLVRCYSFESNSGFKHRLALTLSHTQLIF